METASTKRVLILRVIPLSSVIPIDDLDAPYQGTAGEAPLTFTYDLANIEELENTLLLLNVSNRKRLQVYVHNHTFPDRNNHYYPLGDVGKKALQELFKSRKKMEVFEDSSPFVYEKDQDSIVYRTDFGHLNPEAILPEAEDWIDGLKIAKVTTWSPEKGPVNEQASTFNVKEVEDKIDFVYWAMPWYCDPKVWITVINSHPKEGPVDFTLRMRDYFWTDTYPKKVQKWSEIYDKALEGTDAGDASL